MAAAHLWSQKQRTKEFVWRLVAYSSLQALSFTSLWILIYLVYFDLSLDILCTFFNHLAYWPFCLDYGICLEHSLSIQLSACYPVCLPRLTFIHLSIPLLSSIWKGTSYTLIESLSKKWPKSILKRGTTNGKELCHRLHCLAMDLFFELFGKHGILCWLQWKQLEFLS